MNSENMVMNVTVIPKEIRDRLVRDTDFLDHDTYDRAYALSKSHWGIQSPAFVLYEHFFSIHPYPEVLPQRTSSGLYIAVNSEILPDERYNNYLALHEMWEHYIRVRPEGNLMREDERDYSLPILERSRPAHRFAVLREFQSAKSEGILSDYMDFWRQYYSADELRIRNMPDDEVSSYLGNYGPGSTRNTIVQFIQKNLNLREEIFGTVSR